MRAITNRYSTIKSPVDKRKDFFLHIQGFNVVIDFTYHSIGRVKQRRIYDACILDMVQKGFDEILDLHANERFLLISEELGVSLIGGVKSVGEDIVVSLISSIDSAEPTNPYQTHTIRI